MSLLCDHNFLETILRAAHRKAAEAKKLMTGSYILKKKKQEAKKYHSYISSNNIYNCLNFV